MPTLVGDSIFHVLILEDRQVNFHMASRIPTVLLAMVWTPGTSRSIWPCWHQRRSWCWTPVTLKSHSSLCPWPWSFCNPQPHSWYNSLGSCLGTSPHSTGVEGPVTWGDQSWLQKLNGANIGGMKWGCTGPLSSMHLLGMAWVINHQPSPRLTRLAFSWACLLTQQMAPDSMNEASCATPKLNPSPNNHHP